VTHNLEHVEFLFVGASFDEAMATKAGDPKGQAATKRISLVMEKENF